eukprot:989675_1
MKAATFAITTLLLAIGSVSDAKHVGVNHRKLEKPPSKDLDDKPGQEDLGGNSGKEPGEGNGEGQGRENGVGYGVASGKSGKSGSGNRKLIVRDDSTKPARGHASDSESGKPGRPMKAKDHRARRNRQLEKPPSKDLDDKPGQEDLGGNSGKEPGEGNGEGQGRENGVGYGVASGKSGKSGRKLIVRDDSTKPARGHASDFESGKPGRPMKAKDHRARRNRL